MKLQNFAFTVMLSLVTVAAISAAAQQGQNPLIGEWKLTGGTFAGKPVPMDQMKPNVVIKFETGGRWSDAEGAAATWSVDETKGPKTLDLDYTAGRDQGKKQPCLYEVSADKLTIAFGVTGGKDRPTSLTTTAGNDNVVVFTFERVKKGVRSH